MVRSAKQRHPSRGSRHYYDVTIIAGRSPEESVGSSYSIGAPSAASAKNRAIKKHYEYPGNHGVPIKKIEVREEEVGE